MVMREPTAAEVEDPIRCVQRALTKIRGHKVYEQEADADERAASLTRAPDSDRAAGYETSL